MEELTREQLENFIAIAQKLAYSRAELRKELEENGVQLLPCNFYSPVPRISEVEQSWELENDGMPYLESELYDNEFMLSFMNECLKPYSAHFNPPQEQTQNPLQFYWNNSQFSFVDALCYYCMIRHYRPSRIVEIGSGFSSLIALQALADVGSGELIMIEPYPPEVLTKALQSNKSTVPHTLITDPVQKAPSSLFSDLGENDILFVDSTHTVKAGGDCPFIYLKILPALPPGVSVHAHDIFLPAPMPASWITEHCLYFAEQYLLQAYLLENPAIKVLFAAHYHKLLNTEQLEAFMDGKSEAKGGSFWFRKVG